MYTAEELGEVLKKKLPKDRKMRDIHRIPRILEKIEKVWKVYPNWRFSQLIYNAYDMVDSTRDEDYKLMDIFFNEDEALEEGLDFLLHDTTKNVKEKIASKNGNSS